MSSSEYSRRGVMRAAGGLAVAAAMGTLAGEAAAQAAKPATFVLVPGAWHGAWCYRRVVDLLTAQGHKAFALTLTGLADRSHLAGDAVDLNTHIMDVVNLVKWENLTDIVLVGHSYGGVVIAGAAEKLAGQIASIVFLDAFIPENGQSMADITKRELPTTGFAPPYPAKAMNVNAKDEAWVNEKVTPQPINTYRQKIAITGAYKKIAKKSYIRTTFNNPLFQAQYDALKTQPGWTTFTIDCGHDAMIDKPADLTGLLVKVA